MVKSTKLPSGCDRFNLEDVAFGEGCPIGGAIEDRSKPLLAGRTPFIVRSLIVFFLALDSKFLCIRSRGFDISLETQR